VRSTPPKNSDKLILKWGFEFDLFLKPFQDKDLPSRFRDKMTFDEFKEIRKSFNSCQNIKFIYSGSGMCRRILFWSVTIIAALLFLATMGVLVIFQVNRKEESEKSVLCFIALLIYLGWYFPFLKIYTSIPWEIEMSKLTKRGQNLRSLVAQMND